MIISQTKKRIDIDKKYFKLKYIFLVGIIIGIVLFVLSLTYPPTKDYIEVSKKYFKYFIIPFSQLFIVGFCIYFLMKGGYKTVITKDVKEVGKERVEHMLKQFWLFSVFVLGSGQLLLGHTKRGIIVFLIALFLEINILIFVFKISTMLIPLLIIFLLSIIFWIWNIRDAYNLAHNIEI